MGQEKVIPVNVIEEHITNAKIYRLTTRLCNSAKEEDRRDVKRKIVNQKYYLQKKGLNDEDCDKLIKKSIGYGDLLKVEKSSGILFMLLVWSVVLIITIGASVLLGWFNYNLYTNTHRIWFLTLGLNIIAVICVFVELFYMAKSIYEDIKESKETHEKIDRLSTLEEHRNDAIYLKREHRYTKDAIIFYFAEYASNLDELEAFAASLESV